MSMNNDQPPGAIPGARCQCRAFSDQGWACRNKITQEDLLCDVCRGPCMVLLIGDPPEPLWGHQPAVRLPGPSDG
jgi:hypothetical protein